MVGYKLFRGLLVLHFILASFAVKAVAPQSMDQLLGGLGGGSSDLGRSFFAQCGLGSLSATATGAFSMSSMHGTYQLDAAGCPGVGAASDDDSPSCEDFTVGGRVDIERLLAEVHLAQDAKAAAECRKGKLEGVRAQINCIKQGMSALSQQITAMNPQIQQAMQVYQNYHLQSKNQIDDLTEMTTNAQKMLNGDPATGRPGLLRAKQELDRISQAIPAEVQGMKAGFHSITNQRRAFSEQVEMLRMGRTNKCFNSDTDPSYRCVPNGPPVTAREYLLCRFEQQSRTEGGGRVVDNRASTAQRAAGARQGLEGLLGQLANDSPLATEVALEQSGEAPARRDAATPIKSLSDVERLYGSRLSQYSAPGINVHDFVLGAMRKCSQRAGQSVERERGQANSLIQRGEMHLRYGPQGNAGEEGARRQANELFTKYRNAYAEAWNAMSPSHEPPNDQACRQTTDLRRKLGCLEEYQRRIDSLYNGHGEGAGRSITLNGRPAAAVPGGQAIPGRLAFNCRGLSDCVSQLQTKVVDLNQRKAGLETTVATRKAEINGAYRTAISRVSQQLKSQNDGIRAQIDSLNQVMSSLGIQGSLSPESVDPEPIEKDENDLPRAPQNLMNLVGGQMSPPMFKLDGAGLSEGEGKITERSRELDEQISKLSSRENKLAGLQGSCAATREREVAQQILDSLGEGNECRDDDCPDGDNRRVSEIDSLFAGMEDLNLTTEEGRRVISTLDTGYVCKKVNEAAENDRTSGLPQCSAITGKVRRASTQLQNVAEDASASSADSDP